MAHTCFGAAAQARTHVDPFVAALATRTDEVKRRCSTVLQAEAAAPIVHAAREAAPTHADSTVALV